MPRNVASDATSVLLTLIPRDASGAPIPDIAHDDEDLAVHWRSSVSDDWVSIDLIAGTEGEWVSRGWVHIGEGVYQLSLPNAAVVAGDRTTIRLTYGTEPPQYDSIDAVIPAIDNDAIAALVIAGFSASSVLLSELGRFATQSEINIRQGDDYLAAKGTAYEKTITLAGYDFNAAGLTVRFGAGTTPGTPLITGTASLQNKAVGSVTLRLEFTRDQTKTIPQGSYQWDAELVDVDGKVTTIDGGMLNLQASWTTLT